MESARCHQIYNVNCVRLPNIFLQETSSDHAFKKVHETICHRPDAGNVSSDPGSLRSTGTATCSRKDAQFYLQTFSTEEKGRVNTPNFRSSRIKQLCENKTFSTDLSHLNTRISSTRRLDDKVGPFSGILSCPDCKIPPDIFKNQLWRQIVPNDMPSIRPGFSAISFLFRNMLDRGDLACKGISNSGLLRRLPPSEPRSIQVRSSGCGSRKTFETPRLAGQFQKVHLNSNAGLGIPGDSVANCNKYNGFAKAKDKRHQSCSESNNAKKLHQSSPTTVSSRTTELCQLCNPAWQATLPQNANIFKMFQLETPAAQVGNPPSCTPRTGLVARSHSQNVTDTQLTRNPLSSDGRFRYWLGCSTRRNTSIRRMDNSTKEMAQQQKRAVCCDGSDKKEPEPFRKFTCSNPVRQSNPDSLYPERGRNKVVDVTNSNIPTFTVSRQAQNNSVSSLSPREVQHSSGQVISKEATCRMASASSRDCGSLPEMGLSGNRPICISRKCCRKKIRIHRLERSFSRLYRCFQQTMVLQAGLGISSTQSASQSSVTPKQCQGNILSSSSGMAKSFLALRSEISSVRPPDQNPQSGGHLSGHNNIATSSTSTDINPESLENWGWGALIKNWPTQERELLKKSWRQSTLATYLPAIKRWLTWCSEFRVDSKSPQPEDIARFLVTLYLKENLSYSTILVHKSAVFTFCGPHIENQSFSNFIIKHALKAIGVAKPKEVRVPFTWDPRLVLDWLSLNRPRDGLFDLSRRTATVLLLASGRRIHDLTLLKITSNSYFDNGQNIFFIPFFGSKTDTQSYRQSAWMFSKHENPNICPVTLIRALIEKLIPRRSEVEGLGNLFVTVCGKVKAASRTVIGNWVRTVLKDSGINSSPGSCRSAVASLRWLNNQPIDDILACGNWKSSNTFYSHYCKLIELPKDNTHNSFFKTFTPI